MSERILLDPVEVAAPGRVQVDVTPLVKADPGVEWGDGMTLAYKAQGEIGEDVIDTRQENRQVGIPLAIRAVGGTTFATYRSLLQGAVARWMDEGGVIARITTQGTVYADVPVAGMAQGGNFLQALQRGDVDAELHLEAKPEFYEPEQLIYEGEEKTLPELVKVIPDPGGDRPARVRVVVEDKSGADQKGLIWCFRSRYYSSAATAKPVYSVTELQPLGVATKGAVSGATGGTAVSNNALLSQWGPIVGTNLGGTGSLTHQGTYRAYARLQSPQGDAVSARFVYDVGDLVYPTENPSWTFPGGSAWYVADLGELRLQAPPAGTHRWQGQIQAKGTEGGESISVDRVWFVNTDESMGVLSAPSGNFSSVVSPSAADNFNTTTAGTLTGKVAPLGGTWTAAGDAVGFTVDATNHWVTRSENSDSEKFNGSFSRLGTAVLASTDVSVDISATVPTLVKAETQSGVLARYIDTNNWLLAALEFTVGEGGARFYVYPYLRRKVGGVTKSLFFPGNAQAFWVSSNEWLTLRMTVDSSGTVSFYRGAQGSGSQLTLIASVTDTALASGGGLEKGGVGIYDANAKSGTFTRRYDNFSASAQPTGDAVVYASQKAELNTKGMSREASGVPGSYGPVSRVIGDLPRLPAGGNEGRPVELLVKSSRGDLGQLPDPAIDDVAVKVYASRTWLTVPGG